MKDQTAFSTRFAHHKDELEWLFMELYHNREGLEVLEREMADAYNARSAELKTLVPHLMRQQGRSLVLHQTAHPPVRPAGVEGTVVKRAGEGGV